MPQIGVNVKVYQVLGILFLLVVALVLPYAGIVLLVGFAFSLLERLSKTERRIKSLTDRLTTLESRIQT